MNMYDVEVFDKKNELIAGFNTYHVADTYYAAAAKHGSTKDCLIALGWPLDKDYIKFFEKAYGYSLSDHSCCRGWPEVESKVEFEKAIVNLIELPNVAKLTYKGSVYTDTKISTTSQRIEYDDEVTFVLPDGTELPYKVRNEYLSRGGHNDKLFNELKIYDRNVFMEQFYGYCPNGGDWPTYREDDYSWWCEFAKEMINRGVTIYINDVLYEPSQDKPEVLGDIEKLRQLKQRLDDATDYSMSAMAGIRRDETKCSIYGGGADYESTHKPSISVTPEVKITISRKHKVKL